MNLRDPLPAVFVVQRNVILCALFYYHLVLYNDNRNQSNVTSIYLQLVMASVL